MVTNPNSEKLKSEILDASNEAISNITEFVSELSSVKDREEGLRKEFIFLDQILTEASKKDEKLKDKNYRKALIYYIKGYTLYKLQQKNIYMEIENEIYDSYHPQFGFTVVFYKENDELKSRFEGAYPYRHAKDKKRKLGNIGVLVKINELEQLLNDKDFQTYAKTYTDRIDAMFDNTQFSEAIKLMYDKFNKDTIAITIIIIFTILLTISFFTALITLATSPITMQPLLIAMGVAMGISCIGSIGSTCYLVDTSNKMHNIANQAKLEILAGSLADEIAISNEISAIQNSLTKKINEYGNKNDIDTKNIPENMKIVLKSLCEDKSKNSGDAQKTDNNIGGALINLIKQDYKGDSAKAINDIVKQLDLKTEDGKASPKEDIKQSLNKILHLEMIRIGKTAKISPKSNETKIKMTPLR